jgi:RecA/RadA recombinase
MNIEEQLYTAIQRKQKPMTDKQYISFGNALADTIMGGGVGPVGKMVQIAAPSGAGKSILCTEIIYQAKKQYGDRIHVRYLDKEGGNTFDTETMYGFSLEESFVDDVDTVEELQADLYLFAKQKSKKDIGIYVVDSWDSLSSQDEMEEVDERAKYHEKGKEYTKKTYGAERAKYASKLFRTLIKVLRENNILFVVISQLRDNLNAGMFGPKDLIGGGRALEFYADQRLSLRIKEEEKAEGRLIGQTVELKAIKSRCPYPKRSMYLNLLTAFGVDDVGTNIDYLYDLRDEKGKLKESSVINNIAWKKDTKDVSSSTIKDFLTEIGVMEEAEDAIKADSKRMTQNNLIDWIKTNTDIQSKYVEYFGVLDRASLIQYIVDNDLEEKLAQDVINKWMAIEETIKPVRKAKRL